MKLKPLFFSVSLLLIISIFFNVSQYIRFQRIFENSPSFDITPDYILVHAEKIALSDTILTSLSLELSNYQRFYTTSTDLQDEIAYYCLTVINKEPRKTQPIVYKNKEDEHTYLVVYQSQSDKNVAIKLNLNADGTVSVVERNEKPHTYQHP